MKEGSRAIWTAESFFLSNIAVDDGGALYVWGGSSVHWRAASLFSDNNAEDVGGALCLWDGCSGVWDATSRFSYNKANRSGGALHIVKNCSTVWTAASEFYDNTAGEFGGALSAWKGSSVKWTASSNFSGNNADIEGGALNIRGVTSAIWMAESSFLANTAQTNGGGLAIADHSITTWNARSNFSTNSAQSDGGALFMKEGSRAVWTAESHFLSNNAGDGGGALYLRDGSSVSWTAGAYFHDNSADDDGGAICLSNGCSGVWDATSSFYNNNANGSGGALTLVVDCSAVWTATSNFVANTAEGFGGGLSIWYGSSANWSAPSNFSTNSAGKEGGAVSFQYGSSAVWTSESSFLANNAGTIGRALSFRIDCNAAWGAASYFFSNNAVSSTGALLLGENSVAIWTATSNFTSNTALEGSGGGVYLWDRSTAVWAADSHFLTNSAGNDGGAVYLAQRSSAFWTAPSYFHGNSADDDGGAILLWNGCSAVWDATPNIFTEHVAESIDAALSPDSLFSVNSARFDGGAVFAGKNSTVFWRGNVIFINNTAENGGALYMTDGARTEWRAKAKFISNFARLDGGAIGSRAFESALTSTECGSLAVVGSEESKLLLKGDTIFENNTCGSRGGSMALVQSLTVLFDNKNTTFFHNFADVSGGAVYLEGIGVGTHFQHVNFVGNVAQVDGGVHATGSGTTVTLNRDGNKENNPTTFDGCSFVDNLAFATGGAVDSASGQDAFLGTLFKGNMARVGGALGLAGTSSISNCSFNDNISKFGEGPAVHNLGSMLNLTSNDFAGNIFDCASGMFLDFNESDDVFETVCNGCLDSCTGCTVEEEQQGSPTCTSLSQMGIEHATSSGGTTTVEQLKIEKGYWRATNTSTLIYECFNSKACGGGLTGASDYCHPGYEGPYCSICSKTYVSGTSFSCRKCSDRAIAITIVVILVVLATAIGLATVSYLVFAEGVGSGRRIVEAIMRRVPTQSIKIIIVVWQILTQFTSVANVTFPNGYQRFLEGVNFLNFDLSWVFSIGCFLEVDFHDRLLWTTIGPVIMMGLLGGTYEVILRKHRRSPETVLRDIRHKHVSTALLVTFLVYSSVSSVVFQMFACDDLDDEKSYLRADYRLKCNSPKHRAFQVYAGFMIFLYPVGIPSLYAFLLFSNRHVLRGTQSRNESSVVRPMSDLWKPYKPQRFYYEVIECGRRIMLTSVIVFIYPNTAAQIAVTLAISVAFMIVSEVLAPHESHWDAWISRTGHIVIFTSMYVALLLKVDVSGENATSQKTFGVILIAAHGCMVFVVLVEAALMALSLRAGKHTESPTPRLRNSSTFRQRIQTSLVENVEDAKNDVELFEVKNERNSVNQ